MNFTEIKDVLFREAKRAGLAEYDVYFRMVEDISADALGKEPNSFSSGASGGVSFRCAVNGRIGSASTQSITEEDLAGLVPRAISNAAVIDAEDEPIFFEGSPAYGKVRVGVPPLPDAATLRRTALELQEQLFAASDKMTDAASSGAGAAVITVSLANSKGLDLSHTAGKHYSFAEAIVNEGEESSDGVAFAATVDAAATDIAKKATREALERLGAGNVKTGSYDVIFEARQMRALLGAFSGIFSGKNALLGLSLLAGKEGQKVAADCLTVIDDPFYQENTMQMPFDAEGVATAEKKIIDRGVLTTLLYDLTNAKKAGVESTGNAVRGGVADPVSISPYCLRIEGGKASPDELLAQLGNGIYITELKGLHAGADAVTGDFSIESAGFLVENGQKTRPVHSFTVAGNFFDLLKAIDGVADKVEMGLPALTVVAAPDVLVRGLSVAGE